MIKGVLHIMLNLLEREKILLSDHINFIANGPKVWECGQVQVEGNLANTGYNELADFNSPSFEEYTVD